MFEPVTLWIAGIALALSPVAVSAIGHFVDHVLNRLFGF